VRNIFTLCSSRPKQSIESNSNQLNVEALEDRMMLSTVSVFAQGSTGGEILEVEVLGQGTIATIDSLPTDGFQEFQFSVDESVTADDIRINFVNDQFDANTGTDRNVFVDRIEIDGNVFQTEDASVFSTGTWRQSDGVQPGFGRGNALHANGYLQYSDSSAADSTLIEAELIFTPNTDQINIDVLIDDQVVDTWSARSTGAGDSVVFRYRADGDISPDRIKLAFTNDVFRTDSNGTVLVDNNAQFGSINIGGVNYDPTSQNVFSTGTWRAEDGLTPGFGRGNTLHANGFLQFFNTNDNADGTQIVIDAAGFGDVVDFELQIDEVAVASYSFTPNSGFSQDVLTYRADGQVDPESVRIVFTNDATFNDPTNGVIDRNLQINSVSIDGVVFNPGNDNVFSTGTWTPEDGAVPGFGRGNFLHTNGFFQFFSEVPTNRPAG